MLFMTRKAYERDLAEARDKGAAEVLKEIEINHRFEDIYRTIDRVEETFNEALSNLEARLHDHIADFEARCPKKK
jgi:hypothetical protein